MKYIDATWYDFAINQLDALTKQRDQFIVYDVGAGNSLLEECVTSKGGQWIGFDLTPRRESIHALNLEEVLPTSFDHEPPDIIIFLEVLEHLNNPGKAIENIAKMAKKGSHLIFSTPNPYWSVTRLKFLLQSRFSMFEKSDMLDNHHVYTAWPHVVGYLLEKNGFEILSWNTMGYKASFPKLELSLRYPFKVLFYGAKKLLEWQNESSKGMSYGLLAVKK